jgi:hypothetical protein
LEVFVVVVNMVLHYQEFVRDRKQLATTIRLLIEDLEICFSKLQDPTMIKLYKNRLSELCRLIERDSEYSARQVGKTLPQTSEKDLIFMTILMSNFVIF